MFVLKQIGKRRSGAMNDNVPNPRDRVVACVDSPTDEQFMLYRPSVVACACVLAARSRLGVWPAWPADLSRLTGYSDTSLLTCLHALLR